MGIEPGTICQAQLGLSLLLIPSPMNKAAFLFTNQHSSSYCGLSVVPLGSACVMSPQAKSLSSPPVVPLIETVTEGSLLAPAGGEPGKGSTVGDLVRSDSFTPG